MTHPVDDIDPLIGALTTSPDTACGKTFPGPVLPVGLVQLSPDTISGGDHGGGYSADMETIEGSASPTSAASGVAATSPPVLRQARRRASSSNSTPRDRSC
jgi:putative alpha-1,2-mannosidase